jgi:nucleotide-binding universal stress UspA family protein
MLGSVAKSVVDSARCSVEIVRSNGDPDPFAINRPTRILLATDGSDVSLAASQAVAETIWPAGTEIKVVSVVDPMIYSLEEIGFFRSKGTDRAHRAIGDTMNVLRSTPFEISAEVIAGRTVQGIIDRAKNWHADLIVLGRHQRRGLKRLLLGGTSAAVANGAHCSVRLIRGRVASQSESLPRRSSPSVQNGGSAYKSLGLRKAA